jgi:hypothetical protein
MSEELSISASFATTAGGTAISTGKFAAKLTVAGSYATQATQVINVSPASLEKGGVSTIGYLFLRNLTEPLAVPAGVTSPDITQSGTPGSTGYSYKVVAVDKFGGRSAPTSFTTTTGNSTLNTSNYNVLSWDAVDDIDHYSVYRTATSGTPNTTGFLEDVNAGTESYSDKGMTVLNDSLPEADGIVGASFVYFGTEVDVPLPFRLGAGDFTILRWNGADVLIVASADGTNVDYLMIED